MNNTYIIILMFIYLLIQTLIIRWWAKKKVEQAYEKSAYVAEMWMSNKFGIHHDCDKINTTPCEQLGFLADHLRSLSVK